MEKPKIICLTPVKNESWILDKFLKSASLWADHIIIADQMSTDDTVAICNKYEKVILINNSTEFGEQKRQDLLINEARKIEGPRLLIALDADEMFSPNFETSLEWNTMLNANPGTIFEFQLANVYPDIQNMWLGYYFPWGYMDNDDEYIGALIHGARIPLPQKRDRIRMNDIKVLHFQYADWDRMERKHQWYQCFELIKKVRNPIAIFRMYHHMYTVPDADKRPIPQEWIRNYSDKGIDITSVNKQSMLYWENQVLDYMDQYGTRFFAHLDIWTVSWVEIAMKWDREHPGNYSDPRNIFEKAVNRWLFKTQSKRNGFWMRKFDEVLNLFYK